jgi:hypothetical protein
VCRCDERLKTKDQGYTHLTYTGLSGGLDHQKIETRLRDERFESVKGDVEDIGLPSIFKTIRGAADLTRMLST